MDSEPAEEEEIFQYEMLKEMRKISKSLESINSNLEQMRKDKVKK
jgi:Rod binding domain-containing protein